MRAVKGLDRPAVQWMVIAASVLLAALLAAATLSVRDRTTRIEDLLESHGACRSDLEVLEAQLSKERAAREAFSLELARVRAQQGSGDAASQDTPTLTLVPPAERGPVPPDARAAAPARAQAIQLRLVLPADVVVDEGGFRIAARDWATGRALWSTVRGTTGTVDGRRALIAHVTGEMLGPGSYELTVTAGASADTPEPIAVYEVTVGK